MGKIFKEGIVLSFVNQKGGVGKSTCTLLFANYLFTEGKKNGEDLKIAVIDADDMQRTLSRKREREIDDDTQNLYEIIVMSSSDISSNIEFYKEEYDIILIDMPGNMMQEGIITSYFMIDIAIIPFEASDFDFDSTNLFYELYKDKVVQVRDREGYKTAVKGLFNKVNSNLKEFKEINAAKDDLAFPMMENYIKDSKVLFQRNMNTIGSSDENYNLVGEELLEIILNHIQND